MTGGATDGFVRTPPVVPGMSVGLFGGTFDPPHAAHVHVSETALRRLALQRLWWLVTPGNPLKARPDLSPLADRIAQARAMARDPRIVVSDLEAWIGTRYSIDMLRWLLRRCAGVNFVWVMGADILAQFHRWRHWEEIAASVPLAVVDRPGASLAATASPAAQALTRWRVPEADASRLAGMAPPALVILHGRRVDLSSTMLRKQRGEAPVAAKRREGQGKALTAD